MEVLGKLETRYLEDTGFGDSSTIAPAECGLTQHLLKSQSRSIDGRDARTTRDIVRLFYLEVPGL
ncbi:MAG: hypothetical protein SAK29_33490 [Scytonema sp. PMC 1069.18]|nr:hypothetical protein [Scytonema sp. PMC 1069.18]MEC4887376.1 hypothetical protein [Scytonema sp. PMC 1070.18]